MRNSSKRMVTVIKNDGRPFKAQKQGRNEECRCGSGLKAKKCCGVETQYYVRKKTNEGIQ